jgi:uncharacterized protein
MEEHTFGPAQEIQQKLEARHHGFTDKIFLGPKGIRSGWRLLIYISIFFVLWSACIFVLSLLLRPTPDVFSPTFQLLGELASFLAAFFAARVMAGLEERPFGEYGLPKRGAFGKLFWEGCLFGLIEMSALVGLTAAFGGYSFGGLAQHGRAIAGWAVFWGAFFLVVAFFEEFFFRGYTLYTLSDGIGFWPAALVMAGCFGWVHHRNPGEDWLGVAGVVFIGLFWSFTLKRTGSLWFAVGMHAGFDFCETFLYSVPDSGVVFPGHLSNATLHGPKWLTGGTPGPEASIFDFLLIALFFLAFHFLHPAKPQFKNGQTHF